MESAQLFEVTATANSVAGLLLIVLVAIRLARGHPVVWEELGGNLAGLFRGSRALRFGKFVFSSRHCMLSDRGLSALIWLLRAALVAGAVFFVLAFRATR